MFVLNLPFGIDILETPYSYNQIFAGQHGHWPKLCKLAIHNLAVGTKDLTRLLTLDLPKLRDLAIYEVKLVDGRWEWIIEYMRSFLKLERLHGRPDGAGLVYPGGGYNLPESTSNEQSGRCADRKVLDKVANYVRHGGRHPSLSANQPDVASKGYLEKLQEYLAFEA